jgi:hypothetical protein
MFRNPEGFTYTEAFIIALLKIMLRIGAFSIVIAIVIDTAQKNSDSDYREQARITTGADILLVDANHGLSLNLTNSPSLLENDIGYSPDGTFIYYSGVRFGGENQQFHNLFRYNRHTDETEQLTDYESSSLSLYYLSPNGSHLAFIRDIPIPNQDLGLKNLVILDTHTLETVEFSQGIETQFIGFSWSPSGEEFVTQTTSQSGPQAVYRGFATSNQELLPVASARRVDGAWTAEGELIIEFEDPTTLERTYFKVDENNSLVLSSVDDWYSAMRQFMRTLPLDEYP